MLHVAIVHYHLNRGGVTQVVANHLRAIQAARPREKPRIALLYGGRREGWPDELPAKLERLEIVLHPVAGLEYDDEHAPARPAELARALRAALDELAFPPGETVVHAHNHALGKNVSSPGAMCELAQAGYGLLLQIHDFAEDFRPDQYRRLVRAVGTGHADLPGVLYPQAPHIHYAVLNGRDFSVLQQAGVDTDRLHSLPNPAGEFGTLPPRHAARARLREQFGVPDDVPLVIYPVRGIRRKNLGEALLWSALGAGNVWFGTTLPPLNPLEQPSYSRWKRLAQELKLPFVFELGAPGGLGYLENLAAADLLMTTSVAEGFGMVFLESWLAGLSLVGRDLSEITRDFVAAGLQLPGLQSRLRVPLAWVGQRAFQAALRQAFADATDRYGQEDIAREAFRGQVDSLIEDGHVDFATLSSNLQQEVIQQVHRSEASRNELLLLNPGVRSALASSSRDEATVAHNADVVRRHYSLEQCGRRLLDHYNVVLASSRSATFQAPAHGERILGGFLSLRRFHPIRIES